MAHLLSLLVVASVALSDAALHVGDKIPHGITLDFGFPPEKVDLAERVKGKNVILLGLPGAFTPTWSGVQVPGYLENADALKAAGVDEVIVYCVNDGAVMNAWAADQKVEQGQDGLLTMMGDPDSELTRALGMELSHPGPVSKLGPGRCKRNAMYIVDGVIKFSKISERLDDPAGDDHPEDTCAPAMLKAIAGIHKEL